MKVVSKSMPQSFDAERATLGCMILDKAACAWGFENVRAEWFYLPQHQIVFEVIVDMVKQGGVDLLLVTDRLRWNGKLDRIGGPGFLSGLCNVVPNIENVRYYAGVVRSYYIRRRLIQTGQKLVDYANDGAIEPDMLIGTCKRDLEASEKALGNGHVGDTAAIVQALEARRALIKAGLMPYVASGIDDIDKTLAGGFPRGYIVHIKGERKKGKSALLLQILDQMVNQGRKVFLISLEMRREEIWPRVIAGRLYRLHLQDENFNYSCLYNSADWIEQHPDMKVHENYTSGWWIDDREALTPAEILSAFSYHLDKFDVDVVALDHANLVALPSEHTQQDKEAFIESLRKFAKARNIVLIILTQLQVKDQWAYYYKTIEQSAGTIIHVDMKRESNEASIEVLSRFGPWGKRVYKFIGGVQTFKRPEGGGYYVPGRNYMDRPEQGRDNQAEGRDNQAVARIDSGVMPLDLGGDDEFGGEIDFF
jgi:replicative DNA helicase